MARKKLKSRHTNIEPAVMTMSFSLPAIPAGGLSTNFIDLSQVTSILNRRFYRQGLNWGVSGFKFFTGAGTQGTVAIESLPNTWSMANSWEKVFRAWNRQQREALEDGNQESVRARFNDFKIFADSDHLSAGFAGNLMPQCLLPGGGAISAATPGEWEASQLVIPNFGAPGVNYEPFLTAVGPKVGGAGGSFSLIQLYEDSRSVPHSPDPDTTPGLLGADNILNLMFDVGDNNTDVMANAVGKNNDLPYLQDDYPGGKVQLPGLQVHDTAQYSATTVGGQFYAKGGNFPCGIIKISHINTGDLTTGLGLIIDLIPGPHRGYMCESMTEM